MNIQQEIRNPKNWKQVKTKEKQLFFCKPAIGTEVYNELTGEVFRTVPDKPFVLNGAFGSNCVISYRELVSNYAIRQYSSINPLSPITYKYITEKLIEPNTDAEIKWTKITPIQDYPMSYWAFHLPLSVKNFSVNTIRGSKVANRIGANKEIGDFVISTDNRGMPNFNELIVVDGEEFVSSFDMRAFPGGLDNKTTFADRHPINARRKPKSSTLKIPHNGKVITTFSGKELKQGACKPLTPCRVNGISVDYYTKANMYNSDYVYYDLKGEIIHNPTSQETGDKMLGTTYFKPKYEVEPEWEYRERIKGKEKEEEKRLKSVAKEDAKRNKSRSGSYSSRDPFKRRNIRCTRKKARP